MNNIENWKEVTKGLYRYVIAPGACYEIHIIYWFKSTDLLTANAKLYIVGEYENKDENKSFFERELLFNGPVMACLEASIEDDNKNNSYE